jgi:hypothetical protein
LVSAVHRVQGRRVCDVGAIRIIVDQLVSATLSASVATNNHENF